MDAQRYGYIGVGAFATASGEAPQPVPGYGEVNIEIQISTSSLPGALEPKPPIPRLSYCTDRVVFPASQEPRHSHLATADPTAKPVVDPGWLSDPEDWNRVLAALGLVYRIASDIELAAAGGWSPPPHAHQSQISAVPYRNR